MTMFTRVSYRLTATLLTFSALTGMTSLAHGQPLTTARVASTLVGDVPANPTRDLGDAPDSTNHAGAAMAAYAGVQANYPTVFDPAAGAPSGPAHLTPVPFHLGQQVSREAEADIGPDQDPNNNILPGANTPDLDRFDDGVQPGTWLPANCQKATLPAKVLITPQAFNWFTQNQATGYLNIWVDINRDGDWADGFSCQAGGQVRRSVEHVVIDFPVNVAALGAGTHIIPTSSGYFVWPAALSQLPRWVRVTLSERPAPKPLAYAGIQYGDGRGPLPPYTFGETEDYIARLIGVPAQD